MHVSNNECTIQQLTRLASSEKIRKTIMNMNFGGNQEPNQRSFRHNEERIIFNRLPGTRNFDISEADVLCGRGKLSFNHPGNRRFRDLVAAAVDNYNNAGSRLEKSTVVNAIVDDIRSAGGRFLRRDEDTGAWHALDYAQCREKVGHAIRDATLSTDSKKKRKKSIRDARKDVAGSIGFKSSSESADGDYAAHVAKGATSNDTLQSSINSIVEHYGKETHSFLNPREGGQLEEEKLSSPRSWAYQTQHEPETYNPAATTWPAARAPDHFTHNRDTGNGGGDSSGKNDHDQQFLAYIEQVLGPLPPDAGERDSSI